MYKNNLEKLHDALQVLREFVADCEAAYPEDTAGWVANEWPDLASTYLHAKDVLKGKAE